MSSTSREPLAGRQSHDLIPQRLWGHNPISAEPGRMARWSWVTANDFVLELRAASLQQQHLSTTSLEEPTTRVRETTAKQPDSSKHLLDGGSSTGHGFQDAADDPALPVRLLNGQRINEELSIGGNLDQAPEDECGIRPSGRDRATNNIVDRGWESPGRTGPLFSPRGEPTHGCVAA